MNRIIKFRGKSITEDKWVYGDLSHRENPPTNVSPYAVNGYGVEPDTVGQFTGFFDKNNEEIYEGDIIEGIDIIFVVEYRVRWAAFVAIVGIADVEELGRFSTQIMKKVGNIYDNPELIKKHEK